MSDQTGLYIGDRIRVFGSWGAEFDLTVEMFRDCLGVFMSGAHRPAGSFPPLCDLYGFGAGSSSGYISNYGEYIKDPVALWAQLPRPTGDQQ